MNDTAANPLLETWDTPFGLPPFADIRPEHFAPAFERAMAEHRAELEAIACDPNPPTFENTLAAFDRSGRLLARIGSTFYNLTASETSPELQKVQREMAQPLAAHANAIYLNAPLFARIDSLFHDRANLGLDAESLVLLGRIHFDFLRAGARLQGEARERYAQIMERLAELTTRFGQNVLADEAGWHMPLENEADLAGLPDFLRDAARGAAADRGLEGHVVTLSRSIVVPFLTFSERRDLRERAWRAWTGRGEHAGESDNRTIVRDILLLRAEQADLHGYACYADYALADTMAREQHAVWKLLDDVWSRACEALARERAELDALRAAEGVPATETLEAWDWRYWSEKVRARRFAIDDAEVKPYFPLARMVEAAFDCAGRLFGLRFVPRPGWPVYHPDVAAYEVQDTGGQPLGVFLHDNFARPSKRSGAWMSAFRWQHRNGEESLPVIVNNNNFAKGPPGEATLLSFDDVRTLFHEFGHGLHGLLSSVTYERLSGTHVLRDFVELPSQLFEHWMGEPEVMLKHARHVHTGEAIPKPLIDRLQEARRFGQAYETVRYTASAITDLAIHALPREDVPEDVVAFESQLLRERGAPAGVGLNHRFTHFQHLFSGSGYAAGYYVYLWAEVLDADAYDAFREAGDPFDPATAQRLRRHIYAAGGSVEPGSAYAAFRGRAATVEPMLRKKGLLEAAPA